MTLTVRRALAAILTAIVLAPVATATLPAAAQNADPGIGIRLLEAPATRRDDPRARRFIVDHVNAGTTFSRRGEVSNGTDRPATLSLYAAAASLANGEFVPASGRAANELSGWITLDPPTVTVPPRGTAQFRINVAVPADATPGERYAVALAELPPPPGQGLVGLASRVGIRVYLSVGGGAEPPTDFQLKTFKPVFRGGRPGVDINACNSGGRALDLGGSLKLADGPGGVSAGPFSSTQPATVAPGDCQDLTIELDPKLPKGPWSATAVLRSGTREKEATATITFPDGEGTQGRPVPAKESGRTSDAPLMAALAVALFALAATAAGLTWRRRLRRQ